MKNAFLEGERIFLAPFGREHLAKAQEWINREDLRQWVANMWPLNERHEEQWFERLSESKTDLVLAAHRKENGQHVGNCGLHGIDWINRVAEFGILIAEPNQGFGTEATRLVLRYAFEQLNLNRVQLRVYEYNARALRCYEKAGYRVEGRRRQARYWKNKYHDVLLMGALREEWRG